MQVPQPNPFLYPADQGDKNILRFLSFSGFNVPLSHRGILFKYRFGRSEWGQRVHISKFSGDSPQTMLLSSTVLNCFCFTPLGVKVTYGSILGHMSMPWLLGGRLGKIFYSGWGSTVLSLIFQRKERSCSQPLWYISITWGSGV